MTLLVDAVEGGKEPLWELFGVWLGDNRGRR
jgi:hypothetical protein